MLDIPEIRIVMALSLMYSKPEYIYAWLSTFHPELGDTPMNLINAGKAIVVADMIDGALGGVPT